MLTSALVTPVTSVPVEDVYPQPAPEPHGPGFLVLQAGLVRRGLSCRARPGHTLSLCSEVAMPLRPCLDCGRPSDQSRCAACRSTTNRERDQLRGSSSQRGYDAKHQAERREWAPLVASGSVACWRCNEPVCDPWDLGHCDNDRSIRHGPECARCNRATQGRARASCPHSSHN